MQSECQGAEKQAFFFDFYTNRCSCFTLIVHQKETLWVIRSCKSSLSQASFLCHCPNPTPRTDWAYLGKARSCPARTARALPYVIAFITPGRTPLHRPPPVHQ